jgi:hypothetical protein
MDTLKDKKGDVIMTTEHKCTGKCAHQAFLREKLTEGDLEFIKDFRKRIMFSTPDKYHLTSLEFSQLSSILGTVLGL